MRGGTTLPSMLGNFFYGSLAVMNIDFMSVRQGEVVETKRLLQRWSL
jgi:hypothetical protein